MFFKKSAAAAPGPVEYIIAGLGNPGKKYEGTRHNAGFIILDSIAKKAGAQVNRLKFKSLCGEAQIDGKKALLLKPDTFMNLSGQAVCEAMQFYKLPPEKVIVIYDDISLEPGRMRIRMKGSDGGHNGMKNIIYLSGSDMFPRIKLGVGSKPHPEYDLADWVLSRFTEAEKKLIEQLGDNCFEACALIAAGDSSKAMSQFNS